MCGVWGPLNIHEIIGTYTFKTRNTSHILLQMNMSKYQLHTLNETALAGIPFHLKLGPLSGKHLL